MRASLFAARDASSPGGPARGRSPRADVGRRLVRVLGALLVTSAVASAAFASAPAPTRASWNDAEFVQAPLGALDCAAPAGRFDTRAQGRVLSGTLAGTDLAGVAALQGVTATQTAAGATVQPPPPASTSLGSGAYADPLSVTALGTVYASLGQTLQLPLGAQAGALNTYAQVGDAGRSTGASGLVTDSGGIAAAQGPVGGAPPEIARVRLGAIVSQVLGQALSSRVAGLTDARIRVGDVASRSSLDACASMWGADVYSQLVREYYVAGLGVDLDSPAVSGLTGAVSSTLSGVEARAESLRTDTAFLAAIRAGVVTTIGGLLGALGLGSVDVTRLDLTLDLRAADALLDDTITEPTGIATIDLAAGTVSIDIAKLVGQVYGTAGLNGLPPNTRVLLDGPLLTALRQALTDAVAAWADSVTAAVTTALDSVRVTAAVDVTLLSGPTPVAVVTLGLTNVALGTLLAGGATATSSTVLLGLTCGINPLALGCIVTALVGTLIAPLTSSIGGILGNALKTGLTGTGGLIRTLDGELDARVAPFMTTAAGLAQGVLGPSGLLFLGINAQNAPSPLSGSTGAEPSTWAIPGPSGPRETRQFDVGAVRVVGIGALASGLALDFARSSAGRNAVR